MIGLFDSGHGGLTVLRVLVERFPDERFVYLGDHGKAPYGNRSSDEIVALTRRGVEALMRQGCRLVVLACNTATCVALRQLQQQWLPKSPWAGMCNVVGVVAPTVEAATQTPWGVTAPQYPQKYNSDVIAVFATRRTVGSDVFRHEILKRCPRIEVVQQACPELAGAIEAGAPEDELDAMVRAAVSAALQRTGATPPHRAILGCTHYPLIEPLFRRHLPPATRVLAQADVVAHSLEDYLHRHPSYRCTALAGEAAGAPPRLLTSGDPEAVSAAARRFWAQAPEFEAWQQSA